MKLQIRIRLLYLTVMIVVDYPNTIPLRTKRTRENTNQWDNRYSTTYSQTPCPTPTYEGFGVVDPAIFSFINSTHKLSYFFII